MNTKAIVALALLVVAVVIGVTSFKKSVTPYISFAEARHASGMVQVNGTLASKDYVLKPDEQYDMLRAFGFGAPPRAEFPSEAATAIVRPNLWRDGQEGRPEHAALRW